jgi:hypothetical protein
MTQYIGGELYFTSKECSDRIERIIKSIHNKVKKYLRESPHRNVIDDNDQIVGNIIEVNKQKLLGLIKY